MSAPLSKTLTFKQRHKSSWGTTDDDVFASIKVGRKEPRYLWHVSAREGKTPSPWHGRANTLADAVATCEYAAWCIREGRDA